MTVTWKIEVDWYDNNFNDTNADITQYIKDASWNLGMVDEFERVAGESRFDCTLTNTDKRFSPEGTAGPYYGSIVPKRRIRVRSISSALGTVTHWNGWLERITPQPGTLRERTAKLFATGSKMYLDNKQFYSPLLVNVTADQVIGTIIKKVDEYPPGMERTFVLGHPEMSILGTAILCDIEQGLNFQTGLSTFSYVGDNWDNGVPAMQAIADLTRGERGFFFFDRGGTAVFWDRKHIANTFQTAVGTVASGEWYSLNYSYGENIVNKAIVSVYPRTIGTATDNTLWTLEKPFTLKNQQEKTIRCRFTEPNSDSRVSTDPATCDFTASWTPASRLIKTSATYTAQGAEITFNNTAFFDEVEVTDLTITGIKITSLNKIDVVEENMESRALYGEREIRIDTGVLDDEDTARVIANTEANRRASPMGLIDSISFRGKGETNATQALSWTIGTRINIQDTQTEHNQDYIILGENHSLTNGLKTHDVDYNLMSSSRDTYFVLGKSTLGGSDLLFG